MSEIYGRGANSHLFQPIMKQIPTSPKIVGIRIGYPHVLISTPCYLDLIFYITWLQDRIVR